MSTPEGKVKDKIDKCLKSAGAVYYAKPVQNGMGVPMLDYHACSYGRYFAIEAKAFGKHLTLRQELTKRQIESAGGRVFVITGTKDQTSADGLTELISWLNTN